MSTYWDCGEKRPKVEKRQLHDWQPILSNTASAGMEPHPRSQRCARCGAYSPVVTLGDCLGPPDPTP